MTGWMLAGLSPPMICGDIKDVSHVPAATKAIKIERRRILVEKGGGGV